MVAGIATNGWYSNPDLPHTMNKVSHTLTHLTIEVELYAYVSADCLVNTDSYSEFHILNLCSYTS